jgi:hypothetical protein
MSREAVFETAMCSSLPCLDTRADKHPLSTLFQDELGFYWCPSCRLRGELLNWAKMHGWVEVRAGLYAVGGDEELWKIGMTMGKDEMVETIWRGLFGEEQEVA